VAVLVDEGVATAPDGDADEVPVWDPVGVTLGVRDEDGDTVGVADGAIKVAHFGPRDGTAAMNVLSGPSPAAGRRSRSPVR